jgi:quercetin dioxygenase-like cupin family protein
MTARRFAALGFLCLLAALPMAASAQSAADGPMGRNLADMAFAPIPGLPTCASAAVQTGDPAKGSTIVVSKISAGCVFPWHWHTPSEHLMLASGVARLEMKGTAPFTLRAGGFALMPSKHVHQFRCEQTCLLYVYTDAAFDMHYVNGDGTEIPATDALAMVKEETVK